MFAATARNRLRICATEKWRRTMPFVVVNRLLADVEVDHVRAQWKTYGNLDSYTPGKHHILTFNKISPIGLQRFPSSSYEIFSGDTEAGSKSNAHAILLRSHKLKEEEVAHTVRAIAR
jgi:D-3-phosphoglycerate dehydrogenase / 2-oxoglutarate reductase